MTYDKTKQYEVPFVGGPYDGRVFNVTPADRMVYNQRAENGTLVMVHTYDLQEHVTENGEVVKLEYIYKKP